MSIARAMLGSLRRFVVAQLVGPPLDSPPASAPGDCGDPHPTEADANGCTASRAADDAEYQRALAGEDERPANQDPDRPPSHPSLWTVAYRGRCGDPWETRFRGLEETCRALFLAPPVGVAVLVRPGGETAEQLWADRQSAPHHPPTPTSDLVASPRADLLPDRCVIIPHAAPLPGPLAIDLHSAILAVLQRPTHRDSCEIRDRMDVVTLRRDHATGPAYATVLRWYAPGEAPMIDLLADPPPLPDLDPGALPKLNTGVSYQPAKAHK